MNSNSLTKVLPYVQYEPDTGMIYVLKNDPKTSTLVKHKRLMPDENNSVNASINGTRVKIKMNRFVWFILYGEILKDNETILHKDLDESNFRQNNLTKISKKVHYQILEAMKNLSGSLRIIPHPTDAFSYMIEYRKEGRLKREVLSDDSVAKKKLLQMQIKYIKFLGKYVVSN